MSPKCSLWSAGLRFTGSPQWITTVDHHTGQTTLEVLAAAATLHGESGAPASDQPDDDGETAAGWLLFSL